MKKQLLLLLILSAAALLPAQNVPIDRANYELAARFSPERLKKMVFSTSVDPHWLKLSERFWYTYETSEGKSYYIVDPARRSKRPLFDNVKMAADMSRLTKDPFDAQHLNIENLKFIKDETALQFEVKSKLVEEAEKKEEGDENGDTQEQRQRSAKPKMVAKTWYFEYDLARGALRLLEDFEKPKKHPDWASVAPDESYVLFARDYNLYWMDSENYEKARKNEKDTTIVEHQWTSDGVEHYGYDRGERGQTNVDIEKNKDKRKAVSVVWSPDAQKFAMVRTDQRAVKDLWVLNSVANPRPTLETYKYHMPGEKEAPQQEVLIFDFPTKSQLTVPAEAFKDQNISVLSAPRLKKNRDDELKPNLWLAQTPDKLYFSRTSRDLKRIDICMADTKSGEVKVLIEERLNTYVETRNLGLVNNGRELIHWSERDGWAHFYLYDGEGKLKNQITSGPFHCENIEGIDEKNRVLYFSANGREPGEDPYYLHLYRVNFDGTGLRLLNAGNFDHAATMNDAAQFVVNNFSRVNTTPRSVLLDNQGQPLIDLETADLSQLFAAGYRFPEPFKVKAADGITDLYGVMYKPFDFDSTRLYPIIEYVYPGPQTESVFKSFTANMDRTDRQAQLGFIVITVGNLGGHPARSKWYHNYGYGNLRDYGLADKKAAVEQLAARHAFIDIDKVGIFGHSGGGFMSTAAMLVYPDFFKVAVSSAGNHENNIYNRWWSEKHHGVKEITDDKGNVSFEYNIDKNSELAKNLKGKLLICTGDIDNNVHPANTIRMANALIKANKRFDFFIFPGQRHGFGDMNEYFFWLRSDYFSKHLLGDERDSTDMLEMNRDKPMNGKR
ncbi:MAG TPA: DPP IV N-terminal domain-containing protein [Saprospiraceae bacterium]|nr:DPP IV N-terminal domain-containing protein [Saprospiraceae bacterium]HMP25539.1 DPP IV N-terminal domain-containing protein [Saprospiraceae bacterium]